MTSLRSEFAFLRRKIENQLDEFEKRLDEHERNRTESKSRLPCHEPSNREGRTRNRFQFVCVLCQHLKTLNERALCHWCGSNEFCTGDECFRLLGNQHTCVRCYNAIQNQNDRVTKFIATLEASVSEAERQRSIEANEKQ